MGVEKVTLPGRWTERQSLDKEVHSPACKEREKTPCQP